MHFKCCTLHSCIVRHDFSLTSVLFVRLLEMQVWLQPYYFLAEVVHAPKSFSSRRKKWSSIDSCHGLNKNGAGLMICGMYIVLDIIVLQCLVSHFCSLSALMWKAGDNLSQCAKSVKTGQN